MPVPSAHTQHSLCSLPLIPEIPVFSGPVQKFVLDPNWEFMNDQIIKLFKKIPSFQRKQPCPSAYAWSTKNEAVAFSVMAVLTRQVYETSVRFLNLPLHPVHDSLFGLNKAECFMPFFIYCPKLKYVLLSQMFPSLFWKEFSLKRKIALIGSQSRA